MLSFVCLIARSFLCYVFLRFRRLLVLSFFSGRLNETLISTRSISHFHYLKCVQYLTSALFVQVIVLAFSSPFVPLLFAVCSPFVPLPFAVCSLFVPLHCALWCSFLLYTESYCYSDNAVTKSDIAKLLH